MVPQSRSRVLFRLALLGTLSALTAQGYASTCTDSPVVTITSPSDGYKTDNATVDLEGSVSGLCALAELSCGTSAERVVVRSQFLPEAERAWSFDCIGVELDLADIGESSSNEVVVFASGFAPDGSPRAAEAAVTVIQQGPPDVTPPGDGFPVNTPYTSSKVTWNHRNDVSPYYDAFSVNARLGYAGSPLPLPCVPGDSLTVTLYAAGVATPLFTQSFAGGDWGTCTDTRLRQTGPTGGVREISFDRRSDGEVTFYLYLERVEFGPSSIASVRAVDSYLLHIAMSTSGEAAEWSVDIGPECLTFEDFYSGNGDEARTVVRCNR